MRPRGERFEPYIRLRLWHHHLGHTGEPLLVMQKTRAALTSHAEYFDGDKMMWLKRHMIAIDWSNCEDLKDEVAAYFLQREGRQS
jgi:hypothetical protein